MPIYPSKRNATTAACKPRLIYRHLNRLIAQIAFCGQRPFCNPDQSRPNGGKCGNIAAIKAGARIIGDRTKADHADLFGHALQFAQLARDIGQIVQAHLLGEAAHGNAKFRQRPCDHLFGGRRAKIAVDRGDWFRILAYPFNQRQR